MFGWHQKIPDNSSYLKCNFTQVMRMDYMVYFIFFTWLLIPLILMGALYIEIFSIISKRLSQRAKSVHGKRSFYGKEYKMAKSLALILILFAMSWLPLSIMNCIFHLAKLDIPKPLIYLAILLSHSNSAMNPIVYAYKIKKFRETYVLILRTYVLCSDQESVVPSIQQTAEQKAQAQRDCNSQNKSI
uniref:G-protein coupled receptors family 1 profile domain-containing protein n=1 Tax=Sphenodon punctatus TaxID=8508 RepID=A0A8D0GEV4_SPHPU